MKPLRVFIYYASEDRDFRQRLERHLGVLQQQQVITVWHDEKILSGSVWNAEIQQNLDEADIILFLVSADLLASEYVTNEELPRAMKRSEKGEAIVIPIIIRSCDWRNTLLGQLQALPDGGEPVRNWSNQEQLFVDVIREIRKTCERFQSLKIEDKKQKTETDNIEKFIKDFEKLKYPISADLNLLLSQILQNDPNPEARSLAAQKLGEIGNEDAVPILCKSAINDPIAEVRGSAIRALGKLGDLYSVFK